MKRLMVLAVELAVVTLSADSFGLPVSTIDYRSWLLQHGATPVIDGGETESAYWSDYPPSNAFDGIVNGNFTTRYLGSIRNGAYLTYGADVPDRTFTMTGYRICQLTCGGWCNDRAPTAWILYGSDASTGPWTEIESRSNVTWTYATGDTAPALDDCWREFKMETPQAYKFYKVVFTDSNARSETWDVGVMEIEFLWSFGATPSAIDYRSWLLEEGVTPVIGGGESESAYWSDYPPSKAFDGIVNVHTDYRYLGSIQNGACLTYGADVPNKKFTMTGYRICQLTCGRWCNDRTPTAWTLYGSNVSTGPWKEIESRSNVTWTYTTGDTPPAFYDCWRDFWLAKPQTYKFYKIAFTASNLSATPDNPWDVGVMEVELWGEVFKPTPGLLLILR